LAFNFQLVETNKYPINKGVNRPVEFRGLQAQYVWYLAGAVLAVLFVFSILYLIGLSTYLDVALSLALGGWSIARIYRLSRKYGQHGRMKERAQKAIPTCLRSRSRNSFIQLFNDYVGRTR
jgi:hypothetical protein